MVPSAQTEEDQEGSYRGVRFKLSSSSSSSSSSSFSSHPPSQPPLHHTGTSRHATHSHQFRHATEHPKRRGDRCR
ncbi:hypothetical protein E2C01_014329 [Portunus trituberculatus]|uniref:Uncharacterized protein n=1 Tax=Portunus trituberculatus TaxID=210409 RepID=A0A5B7DK61_PORTR|nr:hypothetical protein [Portunus trituberculatus]